MGVCSFWVHDRASQSKSSLHRSMVEETERNKGRKWMNFEKRKTVKRANLRSERADLKPEKTDLRSERVNRGL